MMAKLKLPCDCNAPSVKFGSAIVCTKCYREARKPFTSTKKAAIARAASNWPDMWSVRTQDGVMVELCFCNEIEASHKAAQLQARLIPNATTRYEVVKI